MEYSGQTDCEQEKDDELQVQQLQALFSSSQQG
jgi:hypothetical protein